MRFISNCNGTASNKKLQNEIDELTNQLGNTQEGLANETSARQLADGNLQTQIGTETIARQDADTTLRNSINTVANNLQEYQTNQASRVDTNLIHAASGSVTNLDVTNIEADKITLGSNSHANSEVNVYTAGITVLPGEWYMLASWFKNTIPTIQGKIGIDGIQPTHSFRLTPDTIETAGTGDIAVCFYSSGNYNCLGIRNFTNNTANISFLQTEGNSVSVNTGVLSTVVPESEIDGIALNGKVYLNNFAVPRDFSVSRSLTAHQLTSTSNFLENAFIQNADVTNLTNSEYNTKKNYVLLDTHQTNTRYYIELPKFNGTYTCTLIKDDVQLFSLEVLEHGDYVEVNYSSIDANDATVDSYLEEFWLGTDGKLYFKTFGDGTLYYSYNAEGELAAPESYSSLPISGNQIAVDYVSHAFTEKAVLRGQIGTVSGANILIAIWTGTQEEYDALTTIDPNTLYLIED